MTERKRPATSRQIASPRGHAGYQLVAVCGDRLTTFELPAQGVVTIGRGPNNQLCLDHPSVSRRHARLHLGERVLIEDLGGSNGTYVRAAAVAGTQATQDLRRLRRESAELRIGESALIGAVSAVLRRGVAHAQSPAAGALARAIVTSSSMRALYDDAARAAKSQISVLILGETGVGKELLARAVHAGSPRAERPFMAINCATLGEHMLEGELFGYERGAFTGAVQARPGLFEAADGGTVFLDEIGELPPPTQAKLLRVLEERKLMRLGGRSAIDIDVRFVAATNRDPLADVGAGRFRQDLYYRINGITFTIPPLRARPSDLLALTDRFVAEACGRLDRPTLAISEPALRALAAHSWPGNVRELRNVIERAVVLCQSCVIGREHLPDSLSGESPANATTPLAAPAPLALAVELHEAEFRRQIDALERSRILESLERTAGNQTKAAKLLGVSRRTLVTRLSELGVPRPKSKSPRPPRD